MVELALEDYPYFEVSAIEYTRNGPSYTYDTILQIYQVVKPKEKINFIIGTDAFRKIESWNQSQKLKDLIKFILFVREDNFDETPYLQLKEKGYEYQLMRMPYINISSKITQAFLLSLGFKSCQIPAYSLFTVSINAKSYFSSVVFKNCSPRIW